MFMHTLALALALGSPAPAGEPKLDEKTLTTLKEQRDLADATMRKVAERALQQLQKAPAGEKDAPKAAREKAAREVAEALKRPRFFEGGTAPAELAAFAAWKAEADKQKIKVDDPALMYLIAATVHHGIDDKAVGKFLAESKQTYKTALAALREEFRAGIARELLAKKGGGSGDKKKRLLVITESKGFRHGCVARKVTLTADLDPNQLPKIPGLEIRAGKPGKDGKVKFEAFYHDRIDAKGIEFKDGMKSIGKALPCLVETTFMELGQKYGFDVVCSQNSRKEIVAENLKNFDAVFFYTTGELPLSDTQKADLLGFIRSGKGFAGSHSATDTFYKWKEYGELIGGYFDGHPWHEKVNVIVEDPKHPATKHLGDSFYIIDEIYQFRGPYTRDKLRVLLRLDMKSVKNQGKRKDGDNALAWIQEYGKGRVFYTALGHRDEVWRDPRFQQHVIGGLRYIFFQENADATPSAAKKN